jgi:hypothetical protein
LIVVYALTLTLSILSLSNLIIMYA